MLRVLQCMQSTQVLRQRASQPAAQGIELRA